MWVFCLNQASNQSQGRRKSCQEQRKSCPLLRLPGLLMSTQLEEEQEVLALAARIGQGPRHSHVLVAANQAQAQGAWHGLGDH